MPDENGEIAMNIDEEIKAYNKAVSLKWKKESHRMLEMAKDDYEAFSKVIIVMIGKNGSVLRTIKKAEREAFCQYIYQNRNDIWQGKFDIFSLDNANFKEKPFSYVTKICHIMSPKKYPLIWDSHVMKARKINYKRDKWNKEIESEKKKVASFSDEQAFENESEIWASIKHKLFVENVD